MDLREFGQVKEAVSGAVAEGRAAEGIEQLAAWAAAGGRAPDRRGETWLYRTLGLGLLGQDRPDEALEHLDKAHDLEPRDAEIGIAFGRLLFEQGRGEESAKVLRAVLIHHKTALEPEVLGGIYRTLGRHYLAEGQLREARSAFDDAIRYLPDDRSGIDGMLAVIAKMPGDDGRRARRMLMSRLTEPADQAYVLERESEAARFAGDAETARQRLEAALRLLPESAALLRAKAELCLEAGSPGEAAEALWAAIEADEWQGTPEQRLSELQRIDQLFGQGDGGSVRHLEVLEAILDAVPESLDHFQRLTRLCVESESWAELAHAYKRMIRRTRHLDPPPNERLLPMLWVNLGELYVSHLAQPIEGIRAMVVASGLRPDDPSVRRRIVRLAQGRVEVREDAYRAATELLELEPSHEQTRRDRTQLAVLTGRYDAALLMLRVMKADGQWDAAYDSVYARLHRPKLKIPETPISDRRRRKYLRPRGQSYVLDSLMAIAGVVFQRLFAHDLTFYGVTEKDRLDPANALLFNQVLAQVATALEVDELPAVYVKPELKGLTNALLDHSALVVGQDLMSGRGPREIAFVCAQKLCLGRPEYLLATVHDTNALKLIVLVLVNYIDSVVPVADSTTTQTLRKELERRLSPELEAHLRETVMSLVEDNLDVNVDAWVESVADEAMFTGLLFASDVEVADAREALDTGVRGVACDDARLQSLHRWAMSGHHLALRRRLGIALRSE